jgi:hypothetical protein
MSKTEIDNTTQEIKTYMDIYYNSMNPLYNGNELNESDGNILTGFKKLHQEVSNILFSKMSQPTIAYPYSGSVFYNNTPNFKQSEKTNKPQKLTKTQTNNVSVDRKNSIIISEPTLIVPFRSFSTKKMDC